MKILYDDQIFQMQRYGGISRYFSELMYAYSHTEGSCYDLTVRFTQNSYASKYDLPNNKLSYKIVSELLSTLGKVNKYSSRISVIKQNLNDAHKAKLFNNSKYDVFHPTYYDPYFLKLIGRKPFVLTVYDMIHEIFPEMYASDDPTSQWKKELVEKAAKVIAISESTKRDLVRILGTPEDKISVVHLANSLTSNVEGGCTIALPEKFILFVGERIRYKNFDRFIFSIAKLLKKEPELYVICAGGGGITEEESARFRELEIADRVLQYSVDDGLLRHLYSTAVMFVFPSLYEGFGMPVLEAFSCGCPVVLSNTSSFPEVAGEAAYYVDPLDGPAIGNAVARLLPNSELRARLIKAGLERVKQFSWEKTANSTMKIYETLV